MKLKELRKIVAELSEEFDEYTVVNGEVGEIQTEDGSNFVYRTDKPIVAMYVDEKDEEVCLFHQTQEDISDISSQIGDIDDEENNKYESTT